MNEFMQWYWSWGIFVSGLLVFIGGFVIGWFRHKERCEKLMHAERLRLAVTNTIEKHIYLEDEWSEG